MLLHKKFTWPDFGRVYRYTPVTTALRTTWLSRTTKTAEIFKVTLDGALRSTVVRP